MVEPRIYAPPPISTPRLAPWDHVEALCNKLDRLIAILEGAAPAPPPEWPGWEPIISKLDEIKNQIKTLEISVTTTWEAKEPEKIYREAIRTVDTFHSEVVNWKRGKRLILKVDNTLDQLVQIQPIGNIIDAIDSSVNINGAWPCAAHGYISIGLAWDDWHPFVACAITTAIAPISGILTITAVIQE